MRIANKHNKIDSEQKWMGTFFGKNSNELDGLLGFVFLKSFWIRANLDFVKKTFEVNTET